MAKIQWKGGALLGPLPPVLVSCGTMAQPNVFTAAWTGIVNTIPPKTYVSIRPSRFSYGLIQKDRQFVLNLTTEALVRAADFCGVRSGRDMDKFAAAGLTAQRAFSFDCPAVAESPLSLECRVTDVIPLGSHDMFLADIVAVSVDETLLDGAGALHLERCALAAYAHGSYYGLGEQLGTFGFSVRKKPLKKQVSAQASSKTSSEGVSKPSKNFSNGVKPSLKKTSGAAKPSQTACSAGTKPGRGGKDAASPSARRAKEKPAAGRNGASSRRTKPSGAKKHGAGRKPVEK